MFSTSHEYVSKAKVNFIASLIVFVIPELREAITSAERFISIPFTFATIASNKIKKAKVGMA